MPGSVWLAAHRSEAAADRILDAAAELYTERDFGFHRDERDRQGRRVFPRNTVPLLR